MALQRERTKSATAIPVRNAWSATSIGNFNQRPGTAIGTCRRSAFSAISPHPPSQSEQRRLAKRSLSADSLFIIPKTQSLESEFQAVLGKTLFEKSVNSAEEDIMSKGDSIIKWTDKPLSRSASAGNSPAMRRSGPPVFEYRTAVTLRPTRCTTPLVNQNQTFRTYFPKGKLDVNAVANAHGLVGHPSPNITPQIHRIRSATHTNLRNFSLKQEYNDSVKETARERYWKRRAELKVLEECIKMDVINEVLANADVMIARRQEERAAVARAEAARLAELERIELEKKRLEEERLARLIENGAQTTITYIEEIKNAGKKPAKGKKKKGKRGKKSASSDGGKSGKSAKKKKKIPKGADDDYDPETIPASILKDERLGSGGSEGSKKRVRFREKLTSTKTIGGSRSSSPKGGKRSSSPGGKKKRGKGKKGKSKVDPVVTPVELPKPEPPPEAPPEPLEEKVEEPKEPMILQMDDPPEFVLADEYRTKNQLVEDWLHYKTCKVASRTHPLIIDL
ncbi:uncharacterized protein [Amphiura filiformis]|uniref:uncharacterized protein n=1 Tax=Amphiura filiformis TaxID=82378 RepID=UPI003B21CA2E